MAPTLPLDICDVERCNCVLVQVEDERASTRRRADRWVNNSLRWFGVEQRRNRGRRDTDH